ncbi:site-specific integrase [Enterococcus avium]|uniref:site-specific integrase n=1 Tax=Enterococcus avium TaxID=33945 RepID=UPI0028903211|nr:site-specific integrase [Enterococcus avium]MDT2394858.1 site-specific integrase [Enterococcus avium]MDT2419285.1 site-specific integrase [Enterococcus avium]MDT2432186.1 site-specific integrase [Enterococcus avium]MDT2441167.1 site-specific integrase [Enterococcus avium]MDT2454087.1 site-specific integrase [Enterococcus avium]
METKDRFKKQISSTGRVTWYFQAFRTTRRGFNSKREAQLAYLEMEKEQRNKKRIVASNDKFSIVGEKWFQYYRSLNEQKESTYDKRAEQLTIINRWIGNKRLCDLSPDELQELIFNLKEKGLNGTDVGYAKNSLQSLIQVLNMVFKYCLKKQLVSENPMKTVRIPKYQVTVRDLKEAVNNVEDKFLTVDELRTFLNYGIVHEELPMSVLFHVLFYTGCRVSEALALQPEDIDFQRNEILFYKQTAVKGKSKDFLIETTKTVSSARRVPVTLLAMEKLKQLIHALAEMREHHRFIVDETYLFVYLDANKRGVPYRREYVNDHVKRCVERSGIGKSFHTHLARHTMASLVAEYCSWDVLKDRLGHTDKTTSKIYRHLTNNEKVKPLLAFRSLED